MSAPTPRADAALAAVIDVGGTHVRVGALARGRPLAGLVRRSTDLLRTGEPVAALVAMVREVEALHGQPVDRVVLGLPTSFDVGMELVLSSPNIPSIEGRRIGVELSAALGRPVTAERDIVLLGRGEWAAGAGQRARTMLGAFMGTGVGGCFLVDGRPYRGASGGVVEIGHIPIRAEGRPCVCGNVDCLEAYSCGHVLNALAAEAGVPVGEIFLRRPPAVAARLDEFVRDFAYALASAVNLMDPERLVIGGGIPGTPSFPRETLIGTVRAHLRRPVPAETVEIAFATLGSEAALHGAAAMSADIAGAMLPVQLRHV